MVSREQRDAWKVKPPCEGENGKCDNECPWFLDCWGELDELSGESDELSGESDENKNVN